MSNKSLVIAASVGAFYFLLAMVSMPVFAFFSLAGFFGGLWFGFRYGIHWWRQLPFLRKARCVSEISRVDYFRRIPRSQLESWVLTALTSRGYVLLGDPVLGRSLIQGYAWMGGKKSVIVMQQERPLENRDLDRIYTLKNKHKVESALLFSPFEGAPASNRPGLEILTDKKFLEWMSGLDGVKPMIIEALPPQHCSCGAQQEQHVSRAGEPLLVCSRFPDCQETQRPGVDIADAAMA